MPPSSVRLPTRLVTMVALLGLAAGFQGCAHTYRVKVDALCNPHVTAGASYRIVPHDEVAADFNAQFDDSVQLIETALASRGLHPATHPRDADLIVEVDFGVGSRRPRAVEDVDLFGATTFKRRSASSRAAGAPTTNSPEPTVSTPQPRVTVVTFYEKFLTLSARETERATRGLRAPVELWRVNVSVEDAATTVDECLPVLILAATEKIGTSTGARENVRVSERAPALLLANSDL